MRLAFDTAVFVYAVGTEHPLRAPCRTLIRAIDQGLIEAEISLDVIQEYVHVRTRKGVDRPQAVDEARAMIALCRVHDVDMPTLQVGLQLFGRHPSLDMRDAIHAATAVNVLAEAIVSPDRDFDGIDGLARLDPADAIASLGLGG